jgi:hypothetical protein
VVLLLLDRGDGQSRIIMDEVRCQNQVRAAGLGFRRRLVTDVELSGNFQSDAAEEKYARN